jgi:hypothetical protein
MRGVSRMKQMRFSDVLPYPLKVVEGEEGAQAAKGARLGAAQPSKQLMLETGIRVHARPPVL